MRTWINVVVFPSILTEQVSWPRTDRWGWVSSLFTIFIIPSVLFYPLSTGTPSTCIHYVEVNAPQTQAPQTLHKLAGELDRRGPTPWGLEARGRSQTGLLTWASLPSLVSLLGREWVLSSLVPREFLRLLVGQQEATSSRGSGAPLSLQRGLHSVGAYG